MLRILLQTLLSLFVYAISVTSNAQLEFLDYKELSRRQLTSDPDRIVVTEFFSYQCPHCYAFDPALDKWLKGLSEDVSFERVPVSIGYAAWTPISQAFFALQTMGELGEIHAEIFRAIHVDRERFYDKESIVKWLNNQGINGKRFSEMYDSFGVNASVRRAEQIANAHNVFSVPSLSVDGKYLVAIYDTGTSEQQLAFERQLVGVTELIERIRAGKNP